MKHLINRRDFVKRSLFATPLCASSLGPGMLIGKGAPKKVVIIGAGLAGLSAAYELTAAGHDATILEARGRSGGRVYTIREPFSDGLYAEGGAQFIPDSHELTMKYVKLFDLTLVPLPGANLPTIYWIRGKRVTVKEGGPVEWPLGLTPEEQKMGLPGMMKRYVESILEEMGDAAAADWPPQRLHKYDRMSFTEFLRMRGVSPDAIALFNMGYLGINGDGLDSYSALSQLRDMILGHGEKEYKIKGGSDLLPGAFAARLSDKIRYRSPVTRIEHGQRGVRVFYTEAGVRQQVAADHLICAVPFSVLKHIEVSPRFSAEKHKAIEELPFTSVTRIYLQTRKKLWLDEGYSGEVYIDSPRMNMFPLGHAGARDIYESFITGPQARRAMRLKPGERIQFALEQGERLLPGLRRDFEGGASKCWDEDEWARGAWAWYRPGQMISLLPHIARPEGRVHFAGEHTSAWPGWMQGALESGNRVAKEINDADDA